MKVEERKNRKLQYASNIQTTPSYINNIQDSDTERAEKITPTYLNLQKNPNFIGKT